MSGYCNESIERLYRAISNIKSPEECRNLLEDLCTIKEIKDMAQRLDTAILLDKGYNYQKIASEVGVSTATISRVSRCLSYGSGGYAKAIEGLESEDSENGNK